MNSCSRPITMVFKKASDFTPDYLSEAFNILFRECGADSFFQEHKTSTKLVEAGMGRETAEENRVG